MTSILQSARRSPRVGREGPDLREIERWFIDQGVPQFMWQYWPHENMSVLLFLLLTVVAFDLAIQPWFGLYAWFLLIAPAMLICFAIIFKITIIDQIRRLASGSLHPIRLIVLSTSVLLVSLLISSLSPDVYWSNLSVRFVVLLGLLWTSAVLFRIDVWEGDSVKLKRRRQRLYFLIAAAVVCFAFKGSLSSSRELMNTVVGSIMPTAVPVPQALAALVITAIIGIQSRGLIRECRAYGQVTTQQQLNAFFPAVPLLILLFCAETTVLPYIGPNGPQIIVPLAIMFSVVPLLIPSYQRRRRHSISWPKRLDVVTANPGLLLFVVLYLVAYPVIVGTLSNSEAEQFSIDAFGRPAAGMSAFILAFGINLFYFILAGAIAGFGLDRVAVWATKEAWVNWRQRVFTLGRGLPLLLVFTTFLLLTAEIWETMVKISTTSYLLVIGLLLGLTGAFHLLTSIKELAKKSEFGKWQDVLDAAGGDRKENGQGEDYETHGLLNYVDLVAGDDRKKDGNGQDHGVQELPNSRDLVAEGDGKKDGNGQDDEIQVILNQVHLSANAQAPEHSLTLLERINGLIVLMTYEVLFFIPVMVSAAILFRVLGHLVVSPAVAANWVYGDNTPAKRGYELVNLPLIEQPWNRVAVLLAVFSILYLAVEVLSDPEKRGVFFENADTAVRRRLAVRLAYQEVRKHRSTR